MAGYGGQMIALDVLTPAENQSQLADTSIKQTQAELDKQALPTRIQTMKSQLEGLDLSNTKSALDLQVQRARTKNEVVGLQQGLIANAFATFDPDAPDASSRWDEMVDKLVEDGAPQAAQYKGRYNPDTAQTWTKAYAALTPTAALTAQGNGGSPAQGGQAGVDGNFAGVSNGAEANQYDTLFARATPQQLQQARDNASAHMAAARRVMQSSNPLGALQQEAVNLGYNQLQVAGVQPRDIPNLIAKIQSTYGPMENYLTARLGRTGAGIPQPEIPAEIKDAGGSIWSIDRSSPSKPKATEIAEGSGKFQPYTDAQGNSWSFDQKSGVFKQDVGGPKGLMRPGGVGGSGRSSVYEQKREAYLSVHPGDNQGSLDYASGKSGKIMTPAEIQKFADGQAQRDYSVISLMGPPTGADGKPIDAQTWINNRTRELSGQLSAVNTATPSAPAGDGSHAAMTAPQRATAQRFAGATAKVGTQANPYVPLTEAQYNKLPSGAVYIRPDGQLYTKK